MPELPLASPKALYPSAIISTIEPLPKQAIPPDWVSDWGDPSPFYRHELRELCHRHAVLAEGIEMFDESETFSDLVGGAHNRWAPIHRWYTFKEAFSYRLPRELLARFGAGASGHVADTFAGVATTALALQHDPRVSKVTGVEYSPFAHLVGQTKLSWSRLHPGRLRKKVAGLRRYQVGSGVVEPKLAAFGNREIFKRSIVQELVSARDRIYRSDLTLEEQSFFLVGLAAVIEDLSGARKDGRALRILRNRSRRQTSLAPVGLVSGKSSAVRDVLVAQWNAMIEDVERAQRYTRVEAETHHLIGDAREIEKVRLPSGSPAFTSESVGLFVYSPPYLNCIDYSEIYKLELWMLELVTSPDEFRDLRLGTLRSHPSVDFPERGYLDQLEGAAVVELLRDLTSFLERNHPRPGDMRVVWQYFDDMYRVLQRQFDFLEPGGFGACVVGNSTFSRRDGAAGRREEVWRVPIVTDLFIAVLAKELGFEGVEIWKARDLRPRNVKGGAARESVVVYRRPAGPRLVPAGR